MASKQSNDGPAPIFVSPAEAGRLLGRGLTHITELIGSGKLKSVKSGRRRLVSYASVVAYADGLLAAESHAEAA